MVNQFRIRLCKLEIMWVMIMISVMDDDGNDGWYQWWWWMMTKWMTKWIGICLYGNGYDADRRWKRFSILGIICYSSQQLYLLERQIKVPFLKMWACRVIFKCMSIHVFMFEVSRLMYQCCSRVHPTRVRVRVLASESRVFDIRVWVPIGTF